MGPLGAVGNQLANLVSDFDPRTFGFRKLSDLVRKTNSFELDHPAGKTMRIQIRVPAPKGEEGGKAKLTTRLRPPSQDDSLARRARSGAAGAIAQKAAALNQHVLGYGALAEAEWAAAGIPAPDLHAMRKYRLERIRAELKRRDYAGVLLYDPVNIRYATNSTNMQPWVAHNPTRHCFVATEGPVILFDYFSCEHLSDHSGMVDEVRPAVSWMYMYSGELTEMKSRGAGRPHRRPCQAAWRRQYAHRRRSPESRRCRRTGSSRHLNSAMARR